VVKYSATLYASSCIISKPLTLFQHSDLVNAMRENRDEEVPWDVADHCCGGEKRPRGTLGYSYNSVNSLLEKTCD
jgi:hypothetical protein